MGVWKWMMKGSGDNSAQNENSRKPSFEQLESRLLLSASIEGTIWNDINANGMQDIGESGLANWTVELDNGLSVTTDSNGQYLFTGLGAGDYTVSPEMLQGWLQTYPISGDGSLGYSGSSVIESASGGSAEISSVVTDSQGNIYLGGAFSGRVDLNPTGTVDIYTAVGTQDLFLIKLNADGSYDWTGTWTGYVSSFEGMTIDGAGNVYVGGTYGGTSDLNPTVGVDMHSSSGSESSFLTRINADGSYGWSRTFGGSGVARAEVADLVSDSQGNVYMTGFFTQTVDFDPTSGTDNRTSPYQNSIYPALFVTRINTDGSYGWTNISQARAGVINAGGLVSGTTIDIDSHGMLYIGGLFENQIDFDPSVGYDLIGHKGDADVFVTQQDTDGNYYGTWQIAGAEEDRIFDLAVDNNNNVTIVGTYSGIVDFDPTSGRDSFTRTAKEVGWYVTRMNANGSYGWTQVWDVDNGTQAAATRVAMDDSGNAYVAVHQPQSGANDARLLTFNSSGQLVSDTPFSVNDTGVWDWSFPGDYPEIWDVAASPTGTIFFAGRLRGTSDLDPTSGVDSRQSAGDFDGFASQLVPMPSAGIVTLGTNDTATNVNFGVKLVDQNSADPTIVQFLVADRTQSILGSTDERTVNVSIQTGTTGGTITQWMITETSSPNGVWQNSAPNTYTITSPGDGGKFLYAWVKDSNGRVSALLPTSQALIVLDSTPPVVGLTTHTVSEGSPAIHGTVDDAGATVYVTINGQTYTATNNLDGTWTIPQGTIAALANGSTVVVMTGTDIFNRTSNPVNADLNVTFTDLEVTLQNPGNGNLISGQILPLTIQIHERAGGNTGPFSVQVRLSLDGNWDSSDIVLTPTLNSLGLAGGQSSGAMEIDFTVPANTPTGNYYILAMVDSENVIAETNEANNIAMTPGPVLSVIEPDHEAPTLISWNLVSDSGVDQYDGITIDNDPTLTFRFSEPVIGTDIAVLVTDPTGTAVSQSLYSITGWGSDVLRVQFATLTIEGEYRVTLTGLITDGLGNPFGGQTITFILDRTKPSATFDALTTYDLRPELTGTYSEPVTELTVRVNGREYSSADGDVQLNMLNRTWKLPQGTMLTDLGEGRHTVTIEAKDLAGNTSQTTIHNELLVFWPGYSQDFSNSDLSDLEYAEWTFNSTGTGDIRIENGSLWMDDTTHDNRFSLNEAILTLDLSSYSNWSLTFDHHDQTDSRESLPETFTGSTPGDGVSVSVDGFNWVRVTALSDESFEDRSFELDALLKQAAILAGYSTDTDYKSYVQIKFQQYGDNPNSSIFSWVIDGRSFDNIRVDYTVEAEIVITGNDINIESGDTTASLEDGTDFGRMYEDGPMVYRTFTIANTGYQILTLDINMPAGFVIIGEAPSQIVPQDSYVLTVGMETDFPGVLSGDVIIQTNDLNENPFTFQLKGEINSLEVGIDTIITNDVSPALTGTVNDPDAVITLHVIGTADLYNESNGLVIEQDDEGNLTWTLPSGILTGLSPNQVYDVLVTAYNLNIPGEPAFNEQFESVLVIETVAPVVGIDNVDPVWGEIIVQNARPRLTGTVDDPNATIKIEITPIDHTDTNSGENDDQTITVLGVNNNGDGTWTLAAQGLTDALAHGLYHLNVIATDQAGNSSSVEAQLFIDIRPPHIVDWIVSGDEDGLGKDFLTHEIQPTITFVFSEPVMYRQEWDAGTNPVSLSDIVTVFDEDGRSIAIQSVVGWDTETNEAILWGGENEFVYAIRVTFSNPIADAGTTGVAFQVHFAAEAIIGRFGEELIDDLDGDGPGEVEIERFQFGTEIGEIPDKLYVRRFDIENVAPQVTLDTKASSSSSPELKGTVDDTSALIYIQIDEGEWIEVPVDNIRFGGWTLPAGSISPGLNYGEYNIRVMAIDPAGNATTESYTLTIAKMAEEFSGENLPDGWTIVDQGNGASAWSVVDGKLVQRSGIASVDGAPGYWRVVDRQPIWNPGWSRIDHLGTFALYESGINWTDITATASLQSSDPDDLGIMFRYQDESNYYRFSMNAIEGYRRLVVVENGEVRVLAETADGFELGQEYQVQVVANGAHLTIVIDGDEVLSTIDYTFASGTIALYTYANSGASFDDVSVLDIVGSNEGPQVTVRAEQTWIQDNQPVQLWADARDIKAGPQPLAYAWFVDFSLGSLSAYDIANPIFTANPVAIGQTVTVTVSVSDGEFIATSDITLTVVDPDAPVLLNESFDNANDNFNDGHYNGWVVVDQGNHEGPSQWEITSEGVAQQSNIHWWQDGIHDRGTFISYEPGTVWTDYQAEFKMTSHDDDGVGMMFRMQDENNYYRFSWNNQNGGRSLIKCVDGTCTLLAADDAMYEIDRTYNVEITAEGSVLQVKIDGREVFNETDETFSNGTVGLYTWGNRGGVFDEVVVNNLRDEAIGARVNEPTISSDVTGDNESVTVGVVANDNANRTISYRWEVENGSGSFSNPNGAITTFTPDAVSSTATMTLRVTVSVPGENLFETIDVYRTVELTVYNKDAYVQLDETFSDESLTDWNVVDQGTINAPSEWKVESGDLVQESNIHSSIQGATRVGTYLEYEPGAGWTDISLSLNMMSQDEDGMGAMFRVQDENNYYRLSWNNTLGIRRLEKVVNGQFFVLAEDQVAYVAGREYNIQILAVGSQLDIFINDQQIFSVNDSSLSSGTIALYSWANQGVHFDNIKVLILNTSVS
ncbi:Ig-like domain-containing protein [Planctomycetota bacterium]